MFFSLLPIPQGHPSPRDIPVSVLPLGVEHESELDRLQDRITIFLHSFHSQLLGQLSLLVLCPACLHKGGSKQRKPGSFPEDALEARRKPHIWVFLSSYFFLFLFPFLFLSFSLFFLFFSLSLSLSLSFSFSPSRARPR